LIFIFPSLIKVAKAWITLALLVFSCLLVSGLDDYLPRDPGPTSSNYGETGLLEIPTARLMSEGSLKIGLNSSFPYEMTVIGAAPFPWMEATFRYTELKNQLYSPYPSFSGNQSYKDKSFDFKFRLFEERRYLPSIAVGFRDIGGTGIFSSEYLTASKEFGPLDLTVGLGWGQLSRAGQISNPLTSIRDSFKVRPGYGADSGGEGGTLNFNSWFSGEEVGVFAGLEYNIKRLGTRLKIEYDTSNQSDPLAPLTPINVSSKINLGLSFPLGKWGEYSFGYQRGNTFQFSFFLKGDYSKENLVPKFDPPPPLAKPNKVQKEKLKNDKNFYYRSLLRNLNRYELYLQGASRTEDQVEITINQSKYISYARAAGRAARVAASLSPEEIKEIEINVLNANSQVSSVKVNREKFIQASNKTISVEELLTYSEIQQPDFSKLQSHEFRPTAQLPDFVWKMGPALRSHIGGPEAFFLGQLWWKTDAVILIRRGLTLYTTLGVNIYDNFDELNNPSDSRLPHVRSDIQNYLKEGKTNIVRMKLDYLWSPMNDVYARIDLGLIEEMYGGIGGEVLYRPHKSKFALGFVAHRVKQRAFNQRFGFRDYEVNTGYAEFFYELPSQITASVIAGQYLAGDKGMTIDLSRRFKTGFRLGVFASKTDISSELFGEGSFDKGFYFQVPTDIFLPTYRTGNISMALHPLTKDGAALLFNHNALYGILGDTDYYSIRRDWRDITN